MSVVVQCEQLSKRYGEQSALEGVNLQVEEGVCFGLLGPNGAGKTTLIRLMLGLARPTAGALQVMGLNPEQHTRQLSSVMSASVEEPRFYGHLSGRHNLRLWAGVLGGEAPARVDGLLERVGLAGRERDRVDDYSLGMRGRLALARCLLADPALLILDEPTNGLDPSGIQGLRELIRALVREEGRTVILSSHLLDEVRRTCDQVCFLHEGRVRESGSLARLLANRVQTRSPTPELAASVLRAAGLRVRADEEDWLSLEGVPADQEGCLQVSRLLQAGGVELSGLGVRGGGLEQLYQQVENESALPLSEESSLPTLQPGRKGRKFSRSRLSPRASERPSEAGSKQESRS